MISRLFLNTVVRVVLLTKVLFINYSEKQHIWLNRIGLFVKTFNSWMQWDISHDFILHEQISIGYSKVVFSIGNSNEYTWFRIEFNSTDIVIFVKTLLITLSLCTIAYFRTHSHVLFSRYLGIKVFAYRNSVMVS